MRIERTAMLASLLLVGNLIATGTAMAGLEGRVFHFDGSTIADAGVRVRNDAADIDERARSSADGRFEFPDLPPGRYVVSVNMNCCLFLPYVNDSVEVGSDGDTQFDIRLVAFNVNVEGDDPATVNADLLARQVVEDRPIPRMADGTPDLSGVWLLSNDPFPETPPAQEWAQEIFDNRAASRFIDSPGAHCLPGSPPIPGGAALITGFVQRPELLVMLLEAEPGFRQVFLDGREHPENPNPTWLGHSVGHWEGDTLVVDTIGFNDRGWVANYPRTTTLRTEERYTRISYGELEVVVTYDDPGVFTAPWSQNMIWSLGPQLDIMEYVCENNKWIDTTAEDVGLAPQ